MLIFTTNAYSNITFFDEVGKELLSLMGHSGTIPGAIKAEDLPEALANLQKGIKQATYPPDLPTNNEENVEPAISLPTRAVPLIKLLQAAINEHCDVLWSRA